LYVKYSFRRLLWSIPKIVVFSIHTLCVESKLLPIINSPSENQEMFQKEKLLKQHLLGRWSNNSRIMLRLGSSVTLAISSFFNSLLNSFSSMSIVFGMSLRISSSVRQMRPRQGMRARILPWLRETKTQYSTVGLSSIMIVLSISGSSRIMSVPLRGCSRPTSSILARSGWRPTISLSSLRRVSSKSGSNLSSSISSRKSMKVILINTFRILPRNWR